MDVERRRRVERHRRRHRRRGDVSVVTGEVVVLNRAPEVVIEAPAQVAARSSATVRVVEAYDNDTVSPAGLDVLFSWSGVV